MTDRWMHEYKINNKQIQKLKLFVINKRNSSTWNVQTQVKCTFFGLVELIYLPDSWKYLSLIVKMCCQEHPSPTNVRNPRPTYNLGTLWPDIFLVFYSLLADTRIWNCKRQLLTNKYILLPRYLTYDPNSGWPSSTGEVTSQG